MNGTIIDPDHCWLIELGNDVTLAPNVHILAHDGSTKYLIGYTRIGRVKIGNNVFIGAGSVILPNVTIGDNVIVGANSTITKSIPEGKIVAGSPARIVGSYEDYVEKNKNELLKSPVFDESYTLRGNITNMKKQEMIEKLDGEIMGYVD